jgi:hypothetical protein
MLAVPESKKRRPGIYPGRPVEPPLSQKLLTEVTPVDVGNPRRGVVTVISRSLGKRNLNQKLTLTARSREQPEAALARILLHPACR